MKSQRDQFAEKFADYLKARIAETRLRQAEIARRSNLSPQTISALVNKKPHHLTGKLLLPERETIDAIADALGRPREEARAAAGYTTEKASPKAIPTLNKSRFASMEEKYESLPEDQQVEMEQILKLVDEELERRSQRTRHTK